MKILIVGGAGYIGSITNKQLQEQGHQTVIFDSMEKGHQWAIGDTLLIKGNLLNKEAITQALKEAQPDAVVHFAAYIQMGESYEDPGKYYQNNVGGSLNLLQAMVENDVENIVFSSTAGVYGQPETLPIPEDAGKRPENPYGQTKLDIEHMLHWFNTAHHLNYIALRYFNAAGAALDTSLGEDHRPESHIIPIFLKRILKNKDFFIFGDNYDTKDGTCVRDYIHVLDLASAHIKALQALEGDQEGDINTAYNVGTGHGYSNKQIAETIIKVTGTGNSYSYQERRSGDADTLVADASKIREHLGWEPKHSDLGTIIESAWAWHQKHHKAW